MNHTGFKANLLSLAIKHSLITASIFSTGMSISMLASANTSTVQAVQIQSSSLAQAINQFAEKTGILINYDAKLIEGKKSAGLNGSYSVETGFAALLAPHGLQLQKTSTGYTIVTSPKVQARDLGQLRTIDIDATNSANLDPNAVQLPVITVNAEKNGSAENGYLTENITGVGIWNERSLQDTPYSMSVVSSDLIENTLAKDMNQIFKMNPVTQERGQYSANVGDVQWPNIRGFQVTSPVINGIPYANYFASAPIMQDIERVEIINGTTGFLYGGGRVGGAVNYVTKKPTIENLKTVSVGTYGNQSYFTHVDLGGQFNQDQTFGYRTNIMFQDGELNDKSESEQKAISLVLDWKPTENLYTDIKYMYKDTLKKGVNTFFMTIDDRSSIKKNQSYSPEWLQNEISSNKAENNVKWHINDIFTFRTNHFYEELKYRGDSIFVVYENNKIVANTANKTYLYRFPEQKSTNYGSNIFVDAKFDTGSVKHILTIGHNFSSSERLTHDTLANDYAIRNNMSLQEFKYSTEPVESLWEGTANLGSLKPNSKIQYRNILIGDDVTFNGKWSALIGLNYATIMNTTYTRGVAQPTYESSKATPTLSLIYKPFEDLTTYATYIESLEASTIVGDIYSNPGEVLDPLTSTQYELGAKYTINQDILLSSALFRIEKANQYSDLALPKPKYVQDGRQIHQGLELTLTGKTTDNLTIIGGGTWMDLNVKKSYDTKLEGKKPTNAASIMAKIYAEYTPSNLQGLAITGGAYYSDQKYGDTMNTKVIPAYILFDMGIRYSTKFGQNPSTFNLNLTNLTDKVYWTNSYQLGDPRTVAFSVKTQF